MVTVIPNILRSDVFHQSVRYAKWLLTQREATFFTNKTWDYSVVHDSAPVLIHPLPIKHDLYGPLEQEAERHVGIRPRPQNILFYMWTKGSYIPWHNDPSCNAALTIYLNDKWDRDYGGLYLYEDGPDIKAIVPQANLGVIQRNQPSHATTPVIHKASIRFTIQVWF